MTSLLSLLLFVFFVTFIISAFVGWIAFLLDLHRYKSQFNFAGPRAKFIDFLLQQQLNETQKGSESE